MRYILTMAASMTVFWLANSGHFSPVLLSMGVVSVALVTWISLRMGFLDHTYESLRLLPRLPRYYLWLIWQIILSNLDLVRRIWLPGKTTDPVVATLPLPLNTDVCRVIYANSINLTPGTLTIDMGEHTLLVHALSHQAIEELERGIMAARVEELEK